MANMRATPVHLERSPCAFRSFSPFSTANPARASRAVVSCHTSNTTSNLTNNASRHESTSLPSSSAAATNAMDRRTALMAASGLLLSGSALTGAGVASAAAVPPFCGVLPVLPPWAFSIEWQEGTVDYAGFKTWYRAIGKPPAKIRKARGFKPKEPPKLPLLVLHGGPGTPSRYLESFELMAGVNRRVVFYDQIGCGQSRKASQGKGPGLSSINPDLFINEIDAVRKELNLEQCHIVGQGWGGMLALAYLAQQEQREGLPGGVASLTLMGTPPSWSSLIKDRQDKAKTLGDDLSAALMEGPSNPNYQIALTKFDQSFVVTSQPVAPACLGIARTSASPSISKAMSGGNPFQEGGVLASWQIPQGTKATLQGTPVLVTRGTKEELSMQSTQQLIDSYLPVDSTGYLEVPNAGTMVHIDAHEALLEKMEQMMVDREAALFAV